MCVFKKILKTRENFRIYVQMSGPNSNFRTFQDKFQNFRTTPRPAKDKNTRRQKQRRSQEFDLGGYKLHDIEFVLGQGDKTTT